MSGANTDRGIDRGNGRTGTGTTSTTSTSTSTAGDPHHHHHHHQLISMGRFLQNANKTLHHWTTKKYALPDKIVASQILMYRQLLHTSCRPGLVLSRPYEGTPAQRSVQHMPWWETTTTTVVVEVVGVDGKEEESAEEGNDNVEEDNNSSTNKNSNTDTPTITDDNRTHRIKPTTTTKTITITMVETGKMVISYDNLIQRLWNFGLTPHYYCNDDDDNDERPHANDSDPSHRPQSLTDTQPPPPPQQQHNSNNDKTKKNNLPSFTIPHSLWVTTLGFQQPDPVTDFRSGGILSLALMVWIVEHCPDTYAKFIPGSRRNSTRSSSHHHHPASVLPFGITSINITDMIAKLLMLSKKFDRMDALLSQKPFWPLFQDPYAILACQELSMELLCIVVQEMVTLRRAQAAGTAAVPSSPSPLPVVNDMLTGQFVTDDNATTTTAATETLNGPDDFSKYISVFDFTHILSVTEERVEYDLLGSGPRTIAELRHVIFEQTLVPKYQQQLQQKLQKIRNEKVNQPNSSKDVTGDTTADDTVATKMETNASTDNGGVVPEEQHLPPQHLHEKVLHGATQGIGHLFSSVAQNPLWNKNHGILHHIRTALPNHHQSTPDDHDPPPPQSMPPPMVDFFDADPVHDTTTTTMLPTEPHHHHPDNLMNDLFEAVDLNDEVTAMPRSTNAAANNNSSVFCISDEG